MIGARPAGSTAPFRRAWTLVMVLAVLASAIAHGTASSAAEPKQVTPRPDIWIKLCGLSTGCTIDPLPHPWLGDDVYNVSGFRQRIAVRMEDGEDVRFWITLQNDAEMKDTFVVHGCRGNARFVIIAVKVGLLNARTGAPRTSHRGSRTVRRRSRCLRHHRGSASI